MSTWAFNIAQFFPSLNHQLLPIIFDKVSFHQKISTFFSNYLISRKTQYIWNNFFSLFFDVNVSIRQGLALLPALLALYFSPLFFIEKLLEKINSFLFYSYNIVSFLLDQFRLIIKHRKTEVFHFSRFQDTFNSSPLNLLAIGGPVLSLKNTQQYLVFIFDRKLIFCQYIDFYSNKILSTVKIIKMLDNSNQGFLPYKKYLLYKTYILLIALYRFSLQFYNKVPLLYLLNKLNKI